MCTSSVYEACEELFASYPLAAINHSETGASMVLLFQHEDEFGFYVLSRDHAEGRSVYSVHPWRQSRIADIDAGGCATIPEVVVNVVTQGVPIPRHGSLFGWRWRAGFTALVAVYAEYTPGRPLPSWAVMPLVGLEEAQWPPFTDKPLFGHWFWEHYRAGSLISLGPLIAGTQDTVFWVDTKTILGADCCAVARDIRSREGYTLYRGRYAYQRSLRAGRPVPALSALLADTNKIDLAPRFAASCLSSDRQQEDS